ncbi:protein kinase [Myxococcota bacterium]|nr:protein kinase [Myxococcota bacterium]MBU1534321.1 protein kinase [Myxococcota bacterium]
MSLSPIDSAELPFPLGTVLEDKFILEKLLGRGAMGLVYLGYDRFLERHVAIKVLKSSHLSKDSIERFRKEAVTMATINHLNVIQIYSFGEKAGNYYFVMEYLKGNTLIHFIDSFYKHGGYIPLDVVIGIISQICSGLGAVHKRGIAHRDIKPANILISEETYHVAITDFGLTSLNPLKNDNFVEGTPLYLAPEAIRGKTRDTQMLHMADIYAVGCIFYELITGHPPFESDNVISLLNEHVKSEIPKATELRPDVPSYVDDIIVRAMAKDPVNRYRTCEDFKEELLNFRMPSKEKRIVRPYLLIFDMGHTGEQVAMFIKNQNQSINIDLISDQNEALAIALNDKPDTIVMVENKGEYSLLELCSLLRHSRIPIFLYLKNKESSMEFLYKEMGVAQIFAPPVDMYLLAETVTNTIAESCSI